MTVYTTTDPEAAAAMFATDAVLRRRRIDTIEALEKERAALARFDAEPARDPADRWWRVAAVERLERELAKYGRT